MDYDDEEYEGGVPGGHTIEVKLIEGERTVRYRAVRKRLLLTHRKVMLLLLTHPDLQPLQERRVELTYTTALCDSPSVDLTSKDIDGVSLTWFDEELFVDVVGGPFGQTKEDILSELATEERKAKEKAKVKEEANFEDFDDF
jgi:hypothetical protein